MTELFGCLALEEGVFNLFTTIEECTNFMFSLKAGIHKREPLVVMREILAHLGNPLEQVKYVHLAGSNGKGSTLNALREMFDGAGYKVGAFISPHLERVNERVTISGVEISDEQFLQYANELFNIIEEHQNGQYPSFFELMTLIAFMHFANEHVDIALMETGIGGRHDCTNVISPLVSIITTISLEHTEILGDTYEKVAYEKAGIIKQGVPVITGVQNDEALSVIRGVAENNHAPLFVLHEDFKTKNIVVEESFQTFDFQLGNVLLTKVLLRMAGNHQVANASLALTAAIVLRSCGFVKLIDGVLRKALEKAQWSGRFERFGNQIVIDGAHNSEGTAALISTLKSTFPNKKYKFIYAAMKDKEPWSKYCHDG